MSKNHKLRLIEGDQENVERYRRNPLDTALNPRAPQSARKRMVTEVEKSRRAGKAVKFKLNRDRSLSEIIDAGWEHRRELLEPYGMKLPSRQACLWPDLQRWAVNYLRHWETNYDSRLIASHDVASSAFNLEVKKSALHAISKAYPELRDECRRQLAHSSHAELAA